MRFFKTYCCRECGELKRLKCIVIKMSLIPGEEIYMLTRFPVRSYGNSLFTHSIN